MDKEKEGTPEKEEKRKQSRRSALKTLAGVPVLGLFSWELAKKISYDKKNQNTIIRELGLEDLTEEVKAPATGKGELLRIGIIGFGHRASALSKGIGYIHPTWAAADKESGRLVDWLAQEDLNVALTGICDVYDVHAQQGMETAANELHPGGGKHSGLPVKRYRSYKEMLDDKSIDAVIIATPDHHHAHMTTEAIQAGKHVYCEKSIALDEESLNLVYNTVKSHDKVFQLGHQITQNSVFKQAKEIIRKNILGKITMIESTTNRNSADGAWIRHLEPDGTIKKIDPSAIDWLQWLGNTPNVPFTVDRYCNWTKFFAYDSGVLGQLFSHEFDAINQLLSIGIPHSVASSGGIYFWKDNREIPDTLHAIFEYPNHDLTLNYSASLASSLQRGRIFMGNDASMDLGGSLSVTADRNSEKYREKIENGMINPDMPMLTVKPGSNKVDAITSATEQYYASRGLSTTTVGGKVVDMVYLHIKEWLDCIRHGGQTSANIDKGFEEGIALLMANISYLEKRRVTWDPVKKKIV